MNLQRKIAIIQKQIDAVTGNGEVPDLEVWRHENEIALRSTIGTSNPTYKKLERVSFSPSVVAVGSGPGPFDTARLRGIQRSIALLKAAISEIELLNEPSETSTTPAIQGPKDSTTASPTTEATVTENKIEIVINDDIYNHISQYLGYGDYYHAVEESYKVVREKLRELTGEEKASEVFTQSAQSNKYYLQLFGKAEPDNQAQGDFFRGIGYLHLGVQFLRNEKAHTPAQEIDPNLAVHYIALASLAYDLISKYVNPDVIQEIENLLTKKHQDYRTASAFYRDFEEGNWLDGISLPDAIQSRQVRKALKIKWLEDADFTRSYDHSNITAMRLELIAGELTIDEVDGLIEKPTVDSRKHSQDAGMLLEVVRFVKQRYPDRVSQKVEAWLLANGDD